MSILNNTLYKLNKNQAYCLNMLLVSFIFLSVLWFILEYNKLEFPMEPIVVAVGGLATLFASYWPWKPGYDSQRSRGRFVTDYTSNNGIYDIGEGDSLFTIKLSNASGICIHVYNDPQNISSVALAKGACGFKEIKDCSVFDFSNRFITANEGDIVVLKNTTDFYALIQIHDIKATSHGDSINEITCSFVINPRGLTDFS